MFLYFLSQKARKFADRVQDSVVLSDVKGSVRLDPHEQDPLLDDWLILNLCALGGLNVTRFNTRNTDHSEEQNEHNVYEAENVAGLSHCF